ncbi:M48 family metalloprotease [Haladaptatus sp. AB643]|uniref:M48 family metalloprotease n=1 Tax=Haladaptatus sp. AB643 TaxID=2934174 RepID=UPI00209C022C|nr:M48 family metalloprotease [Haladaptatus sp. AB643]MCO8246226.1 M48 family metalloprotease [Haladaptatus sp. AB643]
MEWKPDRGLQVRMVATLCLVVLFAIAIPATLWLIVTAGARLVALFTGTTMTAVLIMAGLAGGSSVLGFYVIERYAGSDLTGFPKDGDDEPVVVEVPPEVEARATKIASHLSVPRPDIECRTSNVPTAFTTGYSPESATIVVTTALVETLSADELEAVLAHEFAHVRHRDFLVVTLASLPLRLALRVRKYADRHWALDAERGAHPLVGLFFAFSYALSAVFSFVGRVLLALLSRYRELAADRGAVRITGNAGELASALRKLYDATATRPPADMRDAYEIPPERAIVPLSMATDVDGTDSADADTPWLETHPSLKTRLERLREAEEQFERAS